MKAKLTKRMLDAIEAPAAGEVVAWDTEVVGLAFRVRPNGARHFLCQYRNTSGRTRKAALGRYGNVTLDQARAHARQLLAAVELGEDPVEDRQRGRTAPTVEALAERYLAEHAGPKKKVSSQRNDRQLLRDYILPALGGRRVEDVTTDDVIRLHHRHRAKRYAANRALALLSKLFNLAERWGLRPGGSNPCRHVERHPEEKRKRYLSGDELARLGAVLATEESSRPFAVAAVRLLLFTGARLSEVLTMRWSWVDIERGVVSLPDSKTGAKELVLAAPALAVLAALPRLPENQHVICGEKRGGHLVGLNHIWQRWCRAASIQDARLHDLRHTAASVGVAAGLGLPIIGGLLGHSQPATTARYAHVALDPKRAAAEVIGGTLAAALDRRPLAEVVPLERRGRA